MGIQLVKAQHALLSIIIDPSHGIWDSHPVIAIYYIWSLSTSNPAQIATQIMMMNNCSPFSHRQLIQPGHYPGHSNTRLLSGSCFIDIGRVAW